MIVTFARSIAAVLAALLLLGGAARAQPMPIPYGEPISLETARRVVAGALEEARRNNWTMAAAVVDSGGTLIAFERMDGTQLAGSEIAIAKARSANAFKRPTRAFAEQIARTNPSIMGLPGVVPTEGGIPLIVNGRIVGAIGVSGGSSEQDGVAAAAGVARLQ